MSSSLCFAATSPYHAHAGPPSIRTMRLHAFGRWFEAAPVSHDDGGFRDDNLCDVLRSVVSRRAVHVPSFLDASRQETMHDAHAVYLKRFHGPAARFADHGRERRAVLRADDDARDAEKMSRTNDGAEVLWIHHLVERQPQWGNAAAAAAAAAAATAAAAAIAPAAVIPGQDGSES